MSDNRNNIVTQDDSEDVIDLGEILAVLLRYAWLIILVTLAFGIAGFCYSRFVLPEQFESTTSIYILNRSNQDSSYYNTTELQAGTYLTKDYAELIVSRSVLEQVVTDLQLPYDYVELNKKVSVDTPDDTRIVSITVTDIDPREAQSIANEIRVDASTLIQDVMGVEAVNVIDEANLPLKKSAPSNTKNAILAAMLGFLMSAGVLTVRTIMDDTIKTSEDIEKYLGLSTLAIIPLDEEMHIDDDDSSPKKSKRKSKSKKQKQKKVPARAARTNNNRRSARSYEASREASRVNRQVRERNWEEEDSWDDETGWEE